MKRKEYIMKGEYMFPIKKPNWFFKIFGFKYLCPKCNNKLKVYKVKTLFRGEISGNVCELYSIETSYSCGKCGYNHPYEPEYDIVEYDMGPMTVSYSSDSDELCKLFE